MDSPQQKPFSIAIVGGGLAAVSLARGLLRHGISSQVFEAAPAFADIGAGLSFAGNSFTALEKVDPESYNKFLERVDKVSETKDLYMTYRDGRTDESKEVTTLYCKGSGQQAVHRTLLLKDMVSLLPEGTFHMDKRLSDIISHEAGNFTLVFEDGTRVETDVVIGCDGVKSKTREILLGKDNAESYPKYSGEFGYRGLVPMEKAIEVLGEEFAMNGNVNIGDGILTTTYPVEKGTLLNIVAAKDEPTWEAESWVLPGDKETIEEEFKHGGAKMRGVVSLLDDPQKWSLWHHPSASTFCSGRFLIIGDAAHASTPHQGAGAGQAFEDALVLTALLSDDKVKTPEDVESAFIAFDAIRRPRTLRVVETSRENGAVCMLRGEETGKDLEKIKANLEERFRWIWDEDLDQHVRQAINRLRKEIDSRSSDRSSSEDSSPRLEPITPPSQIDQHSNENQKGQGFEYRELEEKLDHSPGSYQI